MDVSRWEGEEPPAAKGAVSGPDLPWPEAKRTPPPKNVVLFPGTAAEPKEEGEGEASDESDSDGAGESSGQESDAEEEAPPPKPRKAPVTDKVLEFPEDDTPPLQAGLRHLKEKADAFSEQMFAEEGTEVSEETIRFQKLIPGVDEEERREKENPPARERKPRKPPAPPPDLPPGDLASRYGRGLGLLRLRSVLVALLSIPLLYLAFAGFFGLFLPETLMGSFQLRVLCSGGLLAVAWTDFVQGMLMIFAVFVGLFVAFGNAGSLSDVMAAIGAMDPALTSPWINPVTIAGLLSAGWLGYMGQPQIVQMFMGMKDPGSSRRGAVIAGTTGVFLLFGSFFVNLCCMVLFPDSADTSANFILLITEYTPSWLVGIVTAAILAAVMSSADALLHVATTAVTQDFYNKILKKGQATDKQVLVVARVAAVVIGVIAIYLAYNPFDSILWVNWWAWGGLSVFAPILILGFYWKRATREGAMVSMIVGFIAVYVWYQLGLNTWCHYTLVAFVVTGVVHVAVSLVTKAPPAYVQEMVDELNRKDTAGKEKAHA